MANPRQKRKFDSSLLDHQNIIPRGFFISRLCKKKHILSSLNCVFQNVWLKEQEKNKSVINIS